MNSFFTKCANRFSPFRSMVEKYPTFFVSIAYAVLAVIFTFPLILQLNSAMPKGGRDSYLVMSQIENKAAIISDNGWNAGLKIIIKNRDFNSYLPYIIIDQIFHNKYATNNVMFLFSFILSGLGMYLLAFYLTKNKAASFLSGIIFAYSSFHIYQSTAIHVGTRHQELIPFFVLYLMYFFEKFELKFFVLAGLFAFLIAITEHQLLAFTGIFVVFFVLYKLFSNPALLTDKRLWLFFLGASAFLALVATAFFGPLLKVALSSNNFLDAGIKSAVNLSITPIDVLLPPAFHGLWPGANDFIQTWIFHSSRKGDSYYAGIFVLGVISLFLFRIFKEKKRGIKGSQINDAIIKFWLIEVLVFFVISMGPAMQVGKYTAYLPYYLIYRFVPFYINIRTVGRFFVFVLLGLSILFAYATIYFMKKHPSKKMRIIVLFGAFILLDFCIAPMKTVSLSYSSFYEQIASDSEKYKLLEIPGSTNDVFFNYEWITRNVHHKELINGMPMAREIKGEFDMQQGTPVIRQLLYVIPKGGHPDKEGVADIISPFDYGNSTAVLNYYNVRYITISKAYTSDEVVKSEQVFIEKYIETANRYEDDYLVAYEVARKKPIGIFWELKRDNGQFSQLNVDKDGCMWREMGDGAILRIVNMDSQERDVKIAVTARNRSDLIISSSSGVANNSSALNGADRQYSFTATLKPGENIVTFSVKDASGKEVKNSNKKKGPLGSIITGINIGSDN